ncbi:MAG: hypothetical protein WB491_04555 [Candidatus Aquilonibacter sp.]|jgi:hypothetical protein
MRLKALSVAVVIAAAVVFTSLPASAGSYTVDVANESDGWVWVTVRASVAKIIGTRIENIAWYCVGPHSTSHRADFSERPEEALLEMTAQKNCAHPLVNTQGKNADANGNIRATIINNPCAVGYPCVRFRLK